MESESIFCVIEDVDGPEISGTQGMAIVWNQQRSVICVWGEPIVYSLESGQIRGYSHQSYNIYELNYMLVLCTWVQF